MERLGKHNYEAWLLDLAEGNLSSEQEQTLRLFLVTHPELDIDPDALELPHLSPDTEFLDNLETLKKEFNPNEELVLNFLEAQFAGSEKSKVESQITSQAELTQLLSDYSKTQLIPESIEFEWKSGLVKSPQETPASALIYHYFEKQLSPQQTARVTQALQSDAVMRAELAAYEATRLVADSSVVYPDKQSLLRKNKVVALFQFTAWRYAAASAAVLVLAFLVINRQTAVNTPGIATQVKTNKLQSPALNAVQAPIEMNHSNDALALAKSAAVKSTTNRPTDNHPVTTTTSGNTAVNIPSVELLFQEQKIDRSLAENNLSSEKNTAVADQPIVAETGTYYANYNELEISDDFSPLDVPSKKGALWHKAVDVARKINMMGFTAVNGAEESRTRHYRLSFNSISVEKK